MGNKGGKQEDLKLTSEDLRFCRHLSTNMKVDGKLVSKAVKAWKKAAQAQHQDEKTREIKTEAELGTLLDEVAFWDAMKLSGQMGVKVRYLAMGKIFSKEYSMAKKLAEEAFDYPEVRQEVLKSMFVSLDRDNSGSISREEFLQGVLNAKSSNRAKQANVTFDLWDVDNSGTLTKEEIKKKMDLAIQLAFSVTISCLLVTMGILYLDLLETDLKTPSKVRLGRQNEALRWVIARIKPSLQDSVTDAQKHVDTTPIVNKIFELGDTDKNGVLNRDEWIKYSTDPVVQAKIEAFSKECADKAGSGADDDADPFKDVVDKLFKDFPEEFPNKTEEKEDSE